MFNIDKAKMTIGENKSVFIIREYHMYERRPIEVEFYIDNVFKSATFYWMDSLETLREQIKSNGYSGKIISKKNSKTIEYLDISFFNMVKEIIYVKQITKCSSLFSIKFIDVNDEIYTLKKIKIKDLCKLSVGKTSYYYLVENGKDILCSTIYHFKICCYNLLSIKKYDSLKYSEYPNCELIYDEYKERIYNETDNAFLELIKNNIYNCSEIFGSNFSIRKSFVRNLSIFDCEEISIETMGYCKDDFDRGIIKRWYIFLCYRKLNSKRGLISQTEMVENIKNKVNFKIEMVVA